MDPRSIFKIITNSTLLATRLLSNHESHKLVFESKHYCTLVFENTPEDSFVLTVSAKHNEGKSVRYSIVRGNEDGLFSVDHKRGRVTLAASLDHEVKAKHSLTISAESPDGEVSETTVDIRVADVNDNAPWFRVNELKVTVIEEDQLGLPKKLGRDWYTYRTGWLRKHGNVDLYVSWQIVASDADWMDQNELLYTLIGDGVDGYAPEDAFFSIHPRLGILTQLRPLDRDPPQGKSVWKLRVKVHDGQGSWVARRTGGEPHPKATKRRAKRSETMESDSKNWISEGAWNPPEQLRSNNRLYFWNKKDFGSYLMEERLFSKENLKLEKSRNQIKSEDKRRVKQDSNKDVEHTLHDLNSVPQTRQGLLIGGSADQFAISEENKRARQSSVGTILSPIFSNSFGMGYNTPPKFEANKVPQRMRRHGRSFGALHGEMVNISKNIKVPVETAAGKTLSTLKDLQFESLINQRKRDGITQRKWGLEPNGREPSGADTKNHLNATNSEKIFNNYSEITKRNDAITNGVLSRKARHINKDYFKDISTDDHCDLLDSLERPLNASQQSRLKYLVFSLEDMNRQTPVEEVHVVEAVITVGVTDINDNPPLFPNTTIYGEVPENGPEDLLVAMVTAWDADDPKSSTNAVLRYYLEKNAVDERNGAPIFKINPSTGEIRTNLCCLDRESTLEYHLQVVATDGGGLKGTGTVAVRLSDVNDNSPKFTRREWKVVIDETPGATLPPENATLFEVFVNDPDTSNHFLYRVVESSGWGSEFFGIRGSGPSGELFARNPLDFEDERQRRGFRFLVEVTDRGMWNNSGTAESAWVEVSLRDVNDNVPVFQESLIHVTVREDVPINTLITRVNAVDPDQNGDGGVNYRLMEDWTNLKIFPNGEIRTANRLDREGALGPKIVCTVLAIDRGVPPKSATATLVLLMNDINDCAPRLIRGAEPLHIRENSGPEKVGTLFATDDDIWALGHGPPFVFQLDPSNHLSVLEKFELKFIRELDSGRGGAEIWTRGPLDREESAAVALKVLLKDAKELTSSNDVIIIIDDVNDNDMKSANKTAYLWKTQEIGTETAIGRVYVDDLDDWDFADKQFKWAEKPHPFFYLDDVTGEVTASPHVSEGRHELNFQVSDTYRLQMEVPANITVHVRNLDAILMSQSVAISLSPISAQRLLKNWSPEKKEGKLGELERVFEEQLGSSGSGGSKRVAIRVLSVSDGSPLKNQNEPSSPPAVPSTVVWIAAETEGVGVMAAPHLRGLLEMRRKEIEAAFRVQLDFPDPVQVESLGPTVRLVVAHESLKSLSPITLSSSVSNSSSSYKRGAISPAGAASSRGQLLPSDDGVVVAMPQLTLQTVDSNETSLVTPVLSRYFTCPHHAPRVGDTASPFTMPSPHNEGIRRPPSRGEQCGRRLCLNGGRCVPTEKGSRCICPGSTSGKMCKALVRSFSQDGFAWLDPLPPCLPLSVSFRFLSTKGQGVLLYSGPFTDRKAKEAESHLLRTQFYNVKDKSTPSRDRLQVASQVPTPLLLLQISNSKLQLLLSGGIGNRKLELHDNFSDSRWHQIHLSINEKGAFIMSDYCTEGWGHSTANSSHCYDHLPWPNGTSERSPWKVPWSIALPLQLGGLAHEAPNEASHGWEFPIEKNSLKGCLGDLRVNHELMDLGEVSFSRKSQKGCRDPLCSSNKCNLWGACAGGVGSNAYCSCHVGFLREDCQTPSAPVTVSDGRSIKISLSFTPDPFKAYFQLRIKTASPNITVLHLLPKEESERFALYIKEGMICLEYIKDARTGNPTEEKESNFLSVVGEKGKLSISTIERQIKRFGTTTKATPEEGEEELVCLPSAEVADGEWHSVVGGKFGPNLLLEVDDGDGSLRNESLFFSKFENGVRPQEVWMRPHEGAIIGDVNLEDHLMDRKVFHDVLTSEKQKICIDGFRLFGQSIPLSRTSNYTSKWGKVTPNSRFEDGCSVTSQCDNDEKVTLLECGCPKGKTPTALGCKNFDPCYYNPCLHGGICSSNDNRGMNCTCSPSFVGQNCEWELSKDNANGFMLPVLALCISLFIILLAIAGILWKCLEARREENSQDPSERGNTADPSGGYSPKGIDTFKDGEERLNSKMQIQMALRSRKTPEEHRINSLSFSIDESLSNSDKNRINIYNHDDLRAYAYEGDGSSSGSLGSAISGLKVDLREVEVALINPTFKDVVDLLKDLPADFGTLGRKQPSCPCPPLASSHPNCFATPLEHNNNNTAKVGAHLSYALCKSLERMENTNLIFNVL